MDPNAAANVGRYWPVTMPFLPKFLISSVVAKTVGENFSVEIMLQSIVLTRIVKQVRTLNRTRDDITTSICIWSLV